MINNNKNTTALSPKQTKATYYNLDPNAFILWHFVTIGGLFPHKINFDFGTLLGPWTNALNISK